jgi:hypothetical protein
MRTHLSNKKLYSLNGAGFFGGGSPPTPPPPIITQFPNVLAPPNMGPANSISSFSYAEIVDLISDGPIEGLVNKDGIKVYEENIFEGIYLNDSPIKETSSIRKQKISILFLKRALQKHFKNASLNSLFLNAQSTFKTVLNQGSNSTDIDSVNFSSGIIIESFHPNDSIVGYLKALDADFDSKALLEKVFDKTPTSDEKPFLTKITIPKFKIYLPLDRFDDAEGGVNSPAPLKLSIPNLGTHIYFSISSDSLNSFNYFEMPRSYVLNSSKTPSGKSTFVKAKIPNSDYLEYDVYDITIFIWSIFDNGIKNIDNILDRYFSKITVYQNDLSLFNYNTVVSEFKNGNELQSPLQSFNNIEIETVHDKQLIGPFSIMNNCVNSSVESTTNQYKNIYRTVERLTSFGGSSKSAPTSTYQQGESSDDVRYVRAWAVEYQKNGCPYLICNAQMNYSLYDKTTAARTAQEAQPVTHYIVNENVEEVYVTIRLGGLYDINHVDLAANNANKGITDVLKYQQTEAPPAGSSCFSDLTRTCFLLSDTCKGYFLTVTKPSFPTSDVKGIVINHSNDLNSVTCNLRCILSNQGNYHYYNLISNCEFTNRVTNYSSLITYNSAYNLSSDLNNPLYDIHIPTSYCSISPSFCLASYATQVDLTRKLQSISENGSLTYCYGLTTRESVCANPVTKSFLSDVTTSVGSADKTYLNTTLKTTNWKVWEYVFYTASSTELRDRYIVASKINDLIDWNSIFESFNKTTLKIPVTAQSTPLIKIKNIENVYPNINRFIVQPFLDLNRIRILQNSYTDAFYVKNPSTPTSYVIGDLYLIGVNASFLLRNSFWSTTEKDASGKFLLKLDILDQLLETYLFRTTSNQTLNSTSLFSGINSDPDILKGFENLISNFDGGKLIGFSSIYSLRAYTIANAYWKASLIGNEFNIFKEEAKKNYDANNIYIIRDGYAIVNDSLSTYPTINDFIFNYKLYSNLSSNTTNPFTQNKLTYEFLDTGTNKDNTKATALAASKDLAGSVMTIAAGTKLPAIVRVKVETGYESTEKTNYIGPGEYYSYEFQIFGMSSEQSLIDLGRKTYDFVYGRRLSYDKGGYLTANRYLYFSKNLYLVRINVVDNVASTNKTYNFLTIDPYRFIFSDADYLSSKENDITKSISSYSFDADYSGYLQELTSFNKQTLFNEYKTFLEANNSASLNATQLSNFFDDNFTTMNVANALSYLRTANSLNPSSKMFVSSNEKIVENFSFSRLGKTSSYVDNKGFINLFRIFNNSQIQLEVKTWISKFPYNTYQSIPVPGPQDTLTALSFVYMKFAFAYVSSASGKENPLHNFLRKNNFNFICFEAIENVSAPFDGGKFYIIWDNNIYSNYTGIESALSLDKFKTMTSPAVSAITSNNKPSFDLAANAEAYFKEDVLLPIIKDTVTSASLNQYHSFSFLSPADLDWSLYGQLNSNTFYSTNEITDKIYITPYFSVESYDMRIKNDSVQVAEPNFVYANFYTIVDKDKNKISLIFYNPTRANKYKELESDDLFIELYSLIDNYSSTSISITDPSSSTLTSRYYYFQLESLSCFDSYYTTPSCSYYDDGDSYCSSPPLSYASCTTCRDYSDRNATVSCDTPSQSGITYTEIWNDAPYYSKILDLNNIELKLYLSLSDGNYVNAKYNENINFYHVDYNLYYLESDPREYRYSCTSSIDCSFSCEYCTWDNRDQWDNDCSCQNNYYGNYGGCYCPQPYESCSSYTSAGTRTGNGTQTCTEITWYNAVRSFYSKVGFSTNNFNINYTTNYTLRDQYEAAVFNYPSKSTAVSFGFVGNLNVPIQPTVGTTPTVTYFAPNFKSNNFVTMTHPETGFQKTVRIVTMDANIDLNDSQAVLIKVQQILHEKNLLPRDYKLRSYDAPPTVSLNFRGGSSASNIKVLGYRSISISNIDADITNTYANDSGLAIRIPRAKSDLNGNPIRRFVKVTKTSYETLSPLIRKDVYLSKITEIIPQKFSYPFSAIVGTKIDSRAFSQIPVRSFDCKLKKVLVPSNYFPLNENEDDIRYLNIPEKYKIYDGDWDGTFKLMWTNNPAWILMDLLINKRYGLGNFIESNQVDVWELYKIARWCDNVDDSGYYYGVSDGYGGIEPRHAFNGIITDKFNIYDMINQVASVFRGHVYYMNSLITFDDDRLKPIAGEFNNSDVKDGMFNYANHKKDDEYTALDVAFIDEKDDFRPKIEYVEDSEAIRKRGILKKEINSFGITSRGQARRFGKHFLYQVSKENLNVTFSTDNRALLYRPGDLIEINDELQSSIRNFGKILEVEDINENLFKIIIDKKIEEKSLLLDKITIEMPIAKPTYWDNSLLVDNVPSSISLTLNSKELTKNDIASQVYGTPRYETVEVTLTPSGNKNLNQNVQNFSGVLSVPNSTSSDANKKNIDIYLRYINNYDINGNYQKYGHWELGTGFLTGSNLFKFDSINTDKYSILEQNYFFNYFDSGKFYKYTGVDILGNDLYEVQEFDFTNSDPNSYFKFLPSSLENVSKISYLDLLEGNRPSMDTFEISGYENTGFLDDYNELSEYSEVYLFKFLKIKDQNGNLESKDKTLFVDKQADEVIKAGFNYSFVTNIKKQKIYKIMSISETYINEYNILATEYNLDKFKEIEESNEIDDINSTFAYNYGIKPKDILETEILKDSLKAPIINDIYYYQNPNGNKNIVIEWSSVDYADEYELFIKTPSKQTADYEKQINESYFNKSINKYQFVFEQISEVGVYTVYIKAFSRIESTSSPIAQKSFSILEF